MSPFIEIFTPQNFITYRINLIYRNHQYLAFAAIHQTDGWTDGQIDKDRDKKKDMETQRVRQTNRLHSLMKIPSLLTIETMFYLLIEC